MLEREDAVRVLLVCEPGAARQAYVRELERSGVAFDAVDAPGQAHDALVGQPYSGLLLDLPTWIRGATQGKSRLQQVMDWLPVLRLLHHPEQGIRGVSLGGTVRESRDLADFLKRECAVFPPRSLRLAERRDTVHCLLLLDRPDQAAAEGRRAVTANLSASGCFVVTFEEFRRGQELWITFREPPHRKPLAAEVRWVRPWGSGPRMPGIGVRFRSPLNNEHGGSSPEMGELS